MKAKELTIGDLVIFEDNIHKITDLSLCIDGSVLVRINGHNVQIFKHEISPIPLTEEILKLNGLNPISYCDLSMPRWFMSIRNGYRHVEMPFQYVHQLQHALRLCGLNDIADNLKVE